MDRIVVGVSGINAADNPGPGIAVARSLKEAHDINVKIIGLAYDAMEPGLYMDWVVDSSVLMPYPSTSGEDYIARLLYIKNSSGLDMVIPNLDSELPIYIQYADVLAGHGIKTFLPDLAQFKLRSKDRLGEISEVIGLRIPRMELVYSAEGLAAAVETIGLPIMVKGIFYEAYWADSLKAATTCFHKIVARWGYPVIIQEVIEGDHLNVVGVGDGHGESLGTLGIKKVSITSLGKIWTGITIINEPMLTASEKFVRTYKWRGPFEFECIRSGEDIYLIEINPRFPAWTYFATGAGMNLPARMLRGQLNMTCPPISEYDAGMLFVRYSYDLITDMSLFQTLATNGDNL